MKKRLSDRVIPDGERIKSLIAGKGLSLKKVAERAGIDERTLDKVLAGERVKVDTLKYVAGALGVRYEELLAEEDAHLPQPSANGHPSPPVPVAAESHHFDLNILRGSAADSDSPTTLRYNALKEIVEDLAARDVWSLPDRLSLSEAQSKEERRAALLKWHSDICDNYVNFGNMLHSNDHLLDSDLKEQVMAKFRLCLVHREKLFAAANSGQELSRAEENDLFSKDITLKSEAIYATYAAYKAQLARMVDGDVK